MAAEGCALESAARDEACEAAALPSDAEVALELLRRDFPCTGAAAGLPRLLLRSQLHSLLQDRGSAEARLAQLTASGAYAALQLSSGLGDLAYVCRADVEALLSETGCSPQASEALLARVLPGLAGGTALSRPQLARLLGGTGDEAGRWEAELLSAGFLARDGGGEGGFWLAVPGLGVLQRHLRGGRAEVLAALRRAPQRQALARALEAKRCRSALGLRYLLRDLVGSGAVDELEVPAGRAYRLR